MSDTDPRNALAINASRPPVVTIRSTRVSEVEWDRFAALCGSSFRSTHRGTRAWQWDYHLIYRLRRYTCYIGDLKIAQTAVGFGRTRRVFAEGLQILPEHQDLWLPIMAALLSYIGSGSYRYGSTWSLEQCREAELKWICGVAVTLKRPVTVFSIDFRRWKTWEDYQKVISTNAKRNAKRAEKSHMLALSRRCGFASMLHVYHLLQLRKQLFNRKRLDFALPRLILRFLLRTITMGKKSFTALVYADDTPTAGFGGIIFGANTYYLESGSLKNDNGVSWFLFLNMLKDAFQLSPSGRFVTGYHREEYLLDSGLQFFRDQIHSTGHHTSEVEFRFESPSPRASSHPIESKGIPNSAAI